MDTTLDRVHLDTMDPSDTMTFLEITVPLDLNTKKVWVPSVDHDMREAATSLLVHIEDREIVVSSVDQEMRMEEKVDFFVDFLGKRKVQGLDLDVVFSADQNLFVEDVNATMKEQMDILGIAATV